VSKIPQYTYFLPEYCFVLNVLTIGLKTISANINCVLKPVL
jgi:hypothetical protein